MNKRIEGFSQRSILEMLGLKKKTTTAAAAFRSLSLLGLGAMAGLGLGLLLAPRPGRVTRNQIGRQIRQGAWRVADRAQDLLAATQSAGA